MSSKILNTKGFTKIQKLQELKKNVEEKAKGLINGLFGGGKKKE